jgi:hypothetical protein
MNCDKLATPAIFLDSAPAVRGERPAQWDSIGLCFLRGVPVGFSEIIKFLLVGAGFGSLAAIALRFIDLALGGVGGL